MTRTRTFVLVGVVVALLIAGVGSWYASSAPDGLEATADLTARDIRATADGSDFVLVAPHGEVAVELHLPGRHNVLNALAAAGIAARHH